MTWVDDMKADAARVAFPEYELQPGDQVELRVSWDEGYHYSSCTYADPSFDISVEIQDEHGNTKRMDPSPDRADRPWGYSLRVSETGQDAEQFFIRVMELGSKRQ